MLVGNLPLNSKEEELSAFFSTVGKVDKVQIPKNKAGRSIGFAFVTMANQDLSTAAVSALNNAEFKGRTISVSFAKKASASKFNGFLSRVSSLFER